MINKNTPKFHVKRWLIAVNDGYNSNDHIGTTDGIEIGFKSLLYGRYSKELLNEEGIPTPGAYKNEDRKDYHILNDAGCWDRGKVLTILENESVVGDITCKNSKE